MPQGRADEIVLVVEDEERVRRTTVEALRELGYTVRRGRHGRRGAATCCRSSPAVRLLFTDVVMPGKTGRQLVDEVKPGRPDLKVLYTTGYTRNAIVHNGVLDPGVDLLMKPFAIDQLARKVRSVPDNEKAN